MACPMPKVLRHCLLWRPLSRVSEAAKFSPSLPHSFLKQTSGIQFRSPCSFLLHLQERFLNVVEGDLSCRTVLVASNMDEVPSWAAVCVWAHPCGIVPGLPSASSCPRSLHQALLKLPSAVFGWRFTLDTAIFSSLYAGHLLTRNVKDRLDDNQLLFLTSSVENLRESLGP